MYDHVKIVQTVVDEMGIEMIVTEDRAKKVLAMIGYNPAPSRLFYELTGTYNQENGVVLRDKLISVLDSRPRRQW